MRGKSGREYLFLDGDLGEHLRATSQRMLAAIDAHPADGILTSPVETLVDFFVNQHTVTPVVLDEEGIYADEPKETRIDVTGNARYGHRFDGGPVLAAGITVAFHVPFTGEQALLGLKPSRSYMNGVLGSAARGEVVVEFRTTEADKHNIKGEFAEQLRLMRDIVGWSGSDVEAFNTTLPRAAQERIESRRKRLLEHKSLANDLGFPVRRQDAGSRTYAVPEVRRTPRMANPPSKAATPPEPALDAAEYEHILSVCSNMVEVMERSPTAFHGMEEEHLRSHFLVQLNGQYDGGATGETFNYDGKTDILIRYQGRVIFIAECKFWHGGVKFTETVDQLLGYTSWRDTKTSILLFNRNKDTSAVVSQIPGLLSAHPNYVRSLSYTSTTGFRAVLRHRDDPDRHLTLTVLVFDVPR